MTSSSIRIIACTDPAGLYRHFGQEGSPQPCYIELDLREGTLLASYDAEVGGAIPFDTYYGFERRYSIPLLTADAANHTMEALRPHAERIVADWEEYWDGNNMRPRLGEDAQAAEQAILDHLGLGEDTYGEDSPAFDESDLVAAWDIDGAVNGSEADDFGITADTDDDRLDEIAAEITAGLAACGENSVAVVRGLDEYLAEIRDGLAEADRMSDAEFRVLRESLGLTADWLADHLSVSPRTVRHWEQGKYAVPHGVGVTLRGLEKETADLAKETVEELLAEYATGPQPQITVYRTDEAYLASDPEPVRSASWHRAFVARVAQQVPVTITYDA